MIDKALRMTLAAGLIAFGAQASAETLDGKAMLEAFSRCDASFFSYLSRHAQAAGQLGPTYQQADFLNFKVADRLGADSANTLRFANPLPVGKLSLLGFQDSYSNLGQDGRYYYWGFVLAGKPDAVRQALPASIAGQLKPDGALYARGEWRDIGKPGWQAGSATPSGQAPKNGTAERLLLLEAREGQPDESTLLCSLQGSVNPSVLEGIRPDQQRAESDPAYIAAKRELAQAIMQRYALPPLWENADARRAAAQKSVDALRKKDEAAGGRKPEAFWQALAEIQNRAFDAMDKQEAATQDRLRVLFAALMAVRLDKAQLEEAAKEGSPIVAMAGHNVLSVEGIVSMQQLLRLGGWDALLRESDAERSALEKQYGPLAR
ncbi:hypothetical protein CEK28_05380 [Xenophilus sp. AP218F]|nr:hypothetical protein CEK28_05380 [Xenophilus sp. AP218F]